MNFRTVLLFSFLTFRIHAVDVPDVCMFGECPSDSNWAPYGCYKGKCYKISGACEADGTCPAGSTCVQSECLLGIDETTTTTMFLNCIFGECPDDSDGAEYGCYKGKCYKKSGACEADDICPAGSTCVENACLLGIDEPITTTTTTTTASTTTTLTKSTTATTTTATVTPGCADLTRRSGTNSCAKNKYLCYNSLYRKPMQQQCPKTCGYCS